MNQSKFAIADVRTRELNALVKNLMDQMEITDPDEVVRRVNSGEWIVSQAPRRWREEDGVIYFSVTSDGTTGPKWIKRLEKRGSRLSKYANDVMKSEDFKPTNGVTTEIAVLKGELFSDEDRVTSKIREDAERRKLTKPNIELGCLIREKFTNKEIKDMGLIWIVAMHEPIKGSDGNAFFLAAYRSEDGQWLKTYYDKPDNRWNRDNGFAFAVPQISSFLSYLLGEFCFVSCPCQTPSILPILSKE